MAKSPNLNITLKAESKERLKRLAESQKRTMSQLAALLIEEGMDRLENKVKGGRLKVDISDNPSDDPSDDLSDNLSDDL